MFAISELYSKCPIQLYVTKYEVEVVCNDPSFRLKDLVFDFETFNINCIGSCLYMHVTAYGDNRINVSIYSRDEPFKMTPFERMELDYIELIDIIEYASKTVDAKITSKGILWHLNPNINIAKIEQVNDIPYENGILCPPTDQYYVQLSLICELKRFRPEFALSNYELMNHGVKLFQTSVNEYVYVDIANYIIQVENKSGKIHAHIYFANHEGIPSRSFDSIEEFKRNDTFIPEEYRNRIVFDGSIKVVCALEYGLSN